MAAIDLDDPPVPAPAVPRRPSWHRHRRPALVVAVVFALLAGGAAGPVQRPWDRPVVIDGVVPGRLTLDGDTLYLTRPDGIVTAHPAGGGQRWSTSVGEAATLGVDTVGDVVLLRVMTGAGDMSITAVEAGTGVQRWRRDGMVQFVDRAAGLLVFGERTPSAGGPPRESSLLLEAATGREVWLWGARPADATLVLMTGDDGGLAGLVQRDASGRTLILDTATRQARQLADPPPITQAFSSGDDLLLLTDAESIVYDRATLRPRWRFGEPVNVAGRCGPWLCVQGETGTAALDPATGEVRWRRPDGPVAAWDAQVGAGDPQVWLGYGAGPRVTLVDSGSGQPVLDLAGWTGVGGPGAGRQVAGRWHADSQNQIVVVELASRQVSAVTDGVANLDLCASSGEVLACHDGVQRVTMWRLGPA